MFGRHLFSVVLLWMSSVLITSANRISDVGDGGFMVKPPVGGDDTKRENIVQETDEGSTTPFWTKSTLLVNSSTTEWTTIIDIDDSFVSNSKGEVGLSWTDTLFYVTDESIETIENSVQFTRFSYASNLTRDKSIKLIRSILFLPISTYDKVLQNDGIAWMTKEELVCIPSVIIPIHAKLMEKENLSLPLNQTGDICRILMLSSTPLDYLSQSLQHGVRCDQVLKQLEPTIDNSLSHTAVLLEYIKQTSRPAEWSSNMFSDVMRHLGNALTKQDIQAIPDQVIYKSLDNISSVYIPTKSVRHAVVQKLMNRYTSPTAWPDDFLVSMGPLLDSIPEIDQLKLLRNDAVLKVADKLTEAMITKDATRAVISKSILQTIVAAPDADIIRKTLHWLKSDFAFMKNVDLGNFLEAIADTEVEFGLPETHLIAERLENYEPFQFFHIINNTSSKLKVIAKFLPGFSSGNLYFLDLPELEKYVQPIKSRVHADIFYRVLTEGEGLTKRDFDECKFFARMGLKDVESMSKKKLRGCMDAIKQLDIPDYIARVLVNKVAVLVRTGYIEDLIQLLGKHIRHLSLDFLHSYRILPRGHYHTNTADFYMTRPQLITVMNNVKSLMTHVSTDLQASTVTANLTADILGRVGIFIVGLTAEDILHLPNDIGLLSIIEMFSKYEKILDSSQIHAIVDKLREHLQIKQRNVLEDVDEVVILQIGRFLQYLNSDYELVKFPKHLRPLIAQEIGKSSFTRISSRKRQALLKFALKNMKAGTGELVDKYNSASLSANDLMDLGNLLCGLTLDLINKLDADVFRIHIEELQKCPLKSEEMNALLRRALDFNLNILISRAHLAQMGQLLLELSDDDVSVLNKEELVAVSESIVKSIQDSNDVIEEIKQNGFIREHTVLDEKDRNQKIFKLVKLIRESMISQFGATEECQAFYRLQETNLITSNWLGTKENLERCFEYIGGLKWNIVDARHVAATLEIYAKAEIKQQLTAMFLLDHAPNLLPKLFVEDMLTVNMSDDDIVIRLAEVEMLMSGQRIYLFSKWVEDNNKEIVSGEDLEKLKFLACGASAEFIRTRIDSASLRGHLETLSKVVRSCENNEQKRLTAFSEKIASGLNSSDTWSLQEIIQMGDLLGGMNREVISALTKWQVKVIAPDVITHMPDEKITYFTAEQLSYMNANQVSAMTMMQRSYLSDEQKEAIGAIYKFNGGQNQVSNVNNIVMLLMLSFVTHAFDLVSF